ncbi:TRL-like family protein [Leptospira santarosai]|nr:TRL-like family protein [Leptospira santarosai]
MKVIIEYKDFLGSVHFDAEDEVFFGKIKDILSIHYEQYDVLPGKF